MEKARVVKAQDVALKKLGVSSWSIWRKEVSDFDWEYDDCETFHVLEGKARVDTPNGPVEFGKGDLVTFPKGMKCTWHVLEPIKKRYKFGVKQ